MRLRKKPWAKPELEKDNKVIFNPSEFQGKWNECFNNDFPIHLELGCGRGSFIAQLAKLNPKINYIAIDIHPELLVYVLRKANENKLTHLRIIPMYIENIGDIFAPDEIEKIYINFCNPWPNKRHHKRRLTHPNFLKCITVFSKKTVKYGLKQTMKSFLQIVLSTFKAKALMKYLELTIYIKATLKEIL